MNEKAISDWATKLYEGNPRIRRLSVARLRPDDIPRFPKGVCNTVHVMSRRGQVMDSICEGEEIICPVMRMEDFSTEDVERFLCRDNDIFDITILFQRPSRDHLRPSVGVFLAEYLV